MTAPFVRKDTKSTKTFVPDSPKSLPRNKLLRQLKQALRAQSLEVYYQPQISLQDGSCKNFEALVRWNDPVLGTVPPSLFVPLAEECGLIEELTKFVIARVSQDITQWLRARLNFQSVAINISAAHFSSLERAERLLNWLSLDTIPSKFLTLELTETGALQNTDLTRTYFEKLRAKGFDIALDDFGTGHSSVAHLLNLPITCIKLDRSFVSAITKSFKCHAIVRALIELGKVLDLDIVAEGIEHKEQMKLLKTLGCSYAQGYYFAKAMPEVQTRMYMQSRDSLYKTVCCF